MLSVSYVVFTDNTNISPIADTGERGSADNLLLPNSLGQRLLEALYLAQAASITSLHSISWACHALKFAIVVNLNPSVPSLI